MPAATTAQRVRKRRETLRREGLRPVQMWVYDTKAPGFAEECRRQSLAAAEADRNDPDLEEFMELALRDLLEDTPE